MTRDDQIEQQTGAGFHVLAGRTQIELTGGDRAKFLHSLCTNDIQILKPGDGCEAFLTNVQGKVAGYVYVYCLSDSLVLDTVPGEGKPILEGLDRYLIREDVELHDRTGDWAEIVMWGNECGQRLQQNLGWSPPAAPLGHITVESAHTTMSLRRVPYCGAESFFLSCPIDSASDCCDALRRAGVEECSVEAINMVRIESGTPLFGVDVTSDNLPQEVDRNEQAINFNKGCYLGQETIARLDALGHVNRLMVGLRFAGKNVPLPGTILKQNDKPLARITSSCWSSALECPLALGYVRRGHTTPGSQINSESLDAQVVRLPV